MNEEMNNEVAAEEVPSVEAAETAETHEPLVIRKDRAGREWAEVWRDRKILRIRTDMTAGRRCWRRFPMSTSRARRTSCASTRRAGPPSTTTFSATPIEAVAKICARRPPRFAGEGFSFGLKAVPRRESRLHAEEIARSEKL